MNAIRNISRLLPDIIGTHTKRKIIVFESDDWGSIRMPDKKVLKSIPEKFKINFNSSYYKYDSIASSDDLVNLYEALSSIKDYKGNFPVLTANCIVTNPDFNKIEASNFEKYHNELFTTTIEKYHNSKVFNLWKEGIDHKVFKPQLHGREHINVRSWMLKLKDRDELYMEAFKRGIYSVDHNLIAKKKNLTAALDSIDEKDSLEKAFTIKEACDIFYNIFGYKSLSFIAPSYTWDENTEQVLAKKGIKLIQGIRVQKVPNHRGIGYAYKKHYFGQNNKFGQIYLVRNAFFEPSLFKNLDVLNDTLGRIYWSFKFFRPAIISMHRLNFIGGLNKSNRDQNLVLLRLLLKNILNKWPDVEFMSTDELMALYKKQEN